MSGHGTHNRREWKDMELTEDGRPIIYSSRGSHALHPGAGRWPTDFPMVEDETRRGGREIDLARLPVADIRDEPYYGSGDRHDDRPEPLTARSAVPAVPDPHAGGRRRRRATGGRW